MGRTKATAMIVNFVGEGQHEEISTIMRETPFNLIADESTDISSKKSLAHISTQWQEDRLKIMDIFYDLVEVVETDSRTLYNHVTGCFERDKIPYKNQLIGYAADGANNMTGHDKSLSALLKRDVPSLLILKCTCHSIALCSSYACKHVPDNIEQLCREIYNYLSNSPMRTSRFEEIQVLLEYKPVKMLHPSATRWLSLEAVVRRLLDRYEALQIYFGLLVNAERNETVKVRFIFDMLNDPTTKLYLTFLSYVLGLVTSLTSFFKAKPPSFISYIRVCQGCSKQYSTTS
ncbi:uncharacterized protein LOC129724543 [Wyeomyia smithii]|uniref:uncharacterized protein LOC129724543 n=1 Tax=Wyeomyia smithii TaxID=174621 RepID=UPI00246821F8|nr:uncharacterized protein LOC129724543 [Wyeomyia smithii]